MSIPPEYAGRIGYLDIQDDHTVEVAPEIDWPHPLDLRALLASEPEPPQMIIPDWLPCGYATLLAGHGGAGKSSIALYLAACIATGRPFFGLAVEQRRVLYLSCEDRTDVLHWRLARIRSHLGIEVDEIAADLAVMDLVGHTAMLFGRVNGSGAMKTGYFDLLRERFEGYSVLVVDGVADAYGGSENDRGEVKRFVNALVGLIPTDGAVLLQHHVNRASAAGVASSEGYSGSTGWHNSVRARWYLYPETERDDDNGTQPTGELLLDLQKSNLGRADQSMRFRWDDDAHLFIGRMDQCSEFDRRLQDREEREGIVAAIAEVEKSGGYVPAATAGNRTAYAVLRATDSLPDSLKKKAGKQRFWRHLEKLRLQGEVHPDVRGRKGGKRTDVLTLKASNGAGLEGTPSTPSTVCPTPLNGVQGARAPSKTPTQGGYRGGEREKIECPKCGGDGCAWCDYMKTDHKETP
jgi:RecA-family ATPase